MGRSALPPLSSSGWSHQRTPKETSSGGWEEFIARIARIWNHIYLLSRKTQRHNLCRRPFCKMPKNIFKHHQKMNAWSPTAFERDKNRMVALSLIRHEPGFHGVLTPHHLHKTKPMTKTSPEVFKAMPSCLSLIVHVQGWLHLSPYLALRKSSDRKELTTLKPPSKQSE